MSDIRVNLSRFYVEVPQEMDWTRGALLSAHGSEQRLWCALHMTMAVACALFNSLLYFGNALIIGAYIGFSEGARSGLEHCLQQLENSRSALTCSAFSICLLFNSLFAGAAAVRPNITSSVSMITESIQYTMQAPEQSPVEDPTLNLFQPWFRDILITLQQNLLSTIYSESSTESPPHLLQEPLRNWLQYQLQSMILSICDDPVIKRFSNTFSLPEWVQNEAQFQDLLKNLLPDLLYDRLLTLFRGLSPKQIQELPQEPLQEQLSYLRQDLFRAVRQKLVQDVDGLLKEEQWQNELQEQLQSQFRDRLQGLRLAQLRRPIQEILRQELIALLGEDGFQLKHLPEPIYGLFYERLLKLPKCGRSDSSCPLESRLRTDLVADIFLDLFIDQFLEPLRDLTQNKCQDVLTEKLFLEPYTAIRQALFLMVQQEAAEQRSSDCRRNSPLPNIRDALFQFLVGQITLPPDPGQDQAAYPIQAGLAQEPWVSRGGYRGMFQLWYHGLLADLSQGLTTNLLSQCTSEATAYQLNGQIREMLHHHLPAHLQHMILSIIHCWMGTICDRQPYVASEIRRRSKNDRNMENEQIQKMLQEALSEALPEWLIDLTTDPLLTLLQRSLPQQLNEGELQNTLQRQIQDRIPSLYQTLIRTVRQKLYQELNLHEVQHENAFQNQLQDQLQNQFQERLQKLHLSQLHNQLRALGQELLCRDPFPLNINDFSPWTRELCLNRIQPPPQGVFARLCNTLLAPGLNLSVGRRLPQGTLSDLFPHRHPQCRVNDLRSDLLVDLLLDILLDLIEKALPKGFPGMLQEPLLEDLLPGLYKILKKIIDECMAPALDEEGNRCDMTSATQLEDAIQVLRFDLLRSFKELDSGQMVYLLLDMLFEDLPKKLTTDLLQYPPLRTSKLSEGPLQQLLCKMLRHHLPAFFQNLTEYFRYQILNKTSLLPDPGQDQDLAQPIQVGSTQTTWVSRVDLGMFQPWCQWLLADLSQLLTTSLLSRCQSLRTSELPANQLQRQLQEMLRHHLPSHLQHMILNILWYHWKTIWDRPPYMTSWIGLRSENDRNIRDEQIQKLIQEALSEVLPDWLIALPTDPLLILIQRTLPQQLSEDELQNTLQRQIQDRIPNLHQTLVRTVRQKLYQELNLHEIQHENALQNQLQDQLQNQFQERLQRLHLSQLHNPLRALGQELLCRDPFPLNINDFSPWARELCLNRIKTNTQEGVFASLWNTILASILHPSVDRSLLPVTPSDLFPHLHPKCRITALRSDLLVDLLLDILLDLLEKALPRGFPGTLQEPLLEELLPGLYQTLKKIINEDMAPFLDEEGNRRDMTSALQHEEAIKVLRDVLFRSFKLVNYSPQMVGLWEIFENLSQDITVDLLSQCPSLRTSELPADQLQGRLLGMLRHHLSAHTLFMLKYLSSNF